MGLADHPHLTSLIEPILRPLIRRFTILAVNFENDVSAQGLTPAIDELMDQFLGEVDIKYETPLPADGPLLITANHPGAYDFFLIAAAISREDLKIMASNVNIVRYLPAFSEYFIFISQDSVTGDAYSRMSAVRAALRHLKDGGALLVFPSGRVDPDPALASGEARNELTLWSPSTELFLRRVPQTLTTVCIVSRILSSGWYRSPVTWFRRERHYKQKLAEIFQVMQQIILPHSLKISPTIHFSAPLSLDVLNAGDPKALVLPALIREANRLIFE